MNWDELATQVLQGQPVDRAQALAILESDDDQLLNVIAAGYRIRHRYYGRYVRFQLLMNAQSGLCPEDCHYCSQSHLSTAAIPKYPLRSVDEIVAGAERAVALGATTYCIVASGRGPNQHEIDAICASVHQIKESFPLRVCACLGKLKDGQAEQLSAAGVDRYNHNLNTSADYTPNIVSTHTYDDRVDTVERVKASGISPCSGAIFGMGESLDDRVSVAFALRELDVDSIPINFLHPIPGTPFADRALMSPQDCLRSTAMMRFVNPTKEIRLAGGREVQLRHLQPLGLYVANSLFVSDYLTTPGQDPEQDHNMVQDLGFIVEPPGMEFPLTAEERSDPAAYPIRN